MAFAPNFLDAAERYWQDALILDKQDRLASADHLYGICAECALKAVMEIVGSRPLPKKYFVHLPQIWEEFQCYQPPVGPNAYGTRAMPNPLPDWSVHDRYGPSSVFDRARLQKHAYGAREAMKHIEQARLDGWL
jgi:hypothetical protein